MQSFNVLSKLVPVWLLFYFVNCMMENASTCLLLSCNIGNIRDLVASLTVRGSDRMVGFQCNKTVANKWCDNFFQDVPSFYFFRGLHTLDHRVWPHQLFSFCCSQQQLGLPSFPRTPELTLAFFHPHLWTHTHTHTITANCCPSPQTQATL